MAFQLSLYPWIHVAKYHQKVWTGQYREQKHLSPSEEAKLDAKSYDALMKQRNTIPYLPLLNYTNQYGIGCFEGIKAYPQLDGSLKIFRPDRNCVRMASSMKGLRMPPIDTAFLLENIIDLVRRNQALGFTPAYQKSWEAHLWQEAPAVYIRPFTCAEGGIGVNLSEEPWLITTCTTVSAYFNLGSNDVISTKRIRATPHGTGWIKSVSNYTIAALAKQEAIEAGCIETIFLDSTTQKNIEEGSSCNFFAILPDSSLVTPTLEDTILPGITRESVITLARDRGLTVEERPLPIKEVLEKAVECFVTGTAVGITPLGSLRHQEHRRDFTSLNPGSLSLSLLKELKSIQHGAAEDRYGWMIPV